MTTLAEAERRLCEALEAYLGALSGVEPGPEVAYVMAHDIVRNITPVSLTRHYDDITPTRVISHIETVVRLTCMLQDRAAPPTTYPSGRREQPSPVHEPLAPPSKRKINLRSKKDESR